MDWLSLIDGRSRTNRAKVALKILLRNKTKQETKGKTQEIPERPDGITAVVDSRNVESKRANSPNFPHSTSLLSSPRAFSPRCARSFFFSRRALSCALSLTPRKSPILVEQKNGRPYVRPRQKLVRRISTAQRFMSTLQA